MRDADSDLRAALLAKSKQYIKSVVRDPASVKWNAAGAWVEHEMVNVSLDFTTLNGFGAPVRETWYFMFTPEGKIVSLLTPKGEQLDQSDRNRKVTPRGAEIAAPEPVDTKLIAPPSLKVEPKTADIFAVTPEAMAGRSLAEIEAIHGTAVNLDKATGWATWAQFRARFVAGKVVEVLGEAHKNAAH